MSNSHITQASKIAKIEPTEETIVSSNEVASSTEDTGIFITGVDSSTSEHRRGQGSGIHGYGHLLRRSRETLPDDRLPQDFRVLKNNSKLDIR